MQDINLTLDLGKDRGEKSLQVGSVSPVHKEHNLVFERWAYMLDDEASNSYSDSSKVVGKSFELASQGSLGIKFDFTTFVDS